MQPYFITAATVNWVDVFTRDMYRDILIDSLRYCQKNQELQIHAWVLMPNHFHMICTFVNDNDPGVVIKNIKSFTALKMIDAIINNHRKAEESGCWIYLKKTGKQPKAITGFSSGNMKTILYC
jgi:putative transposase